MFANEDQENGDLTLTNGERRRPIQESRVAVVWTWGTPEIQVGIRQLEENNFEARQRGWLLQKFGYLRRSNWTQGGGETARSDSDLKALRARKGTNKETLEAFDVLASSGAP